MKSARAYLCWFYEAQSPRPSRNPQDGHHNSPESATRSPNPRHRLSEGSRETLLRPPRTSAPRAARGWEADPEVLSDTARSPTDPAHTVALAPGTELVTGTELVAVSERAIYRRSLPSEPARRPPLREADTAQRGRQRPGRPPRASSRSASLHPALRGRARIVSLDSAAARELSRVRGACDQWEHRYPDLLRPPA